MSRPDLMDRLRDLDPARPYPGQPTEDGSEAELAAILAHPVDRPTRGRLRRALRRHSARTVAGLLALLVIGGGVAYAAGVPDDVRRAFAGFAAEPRGAAPVPWGDNPARMVASLPLGDGRTVQQWESDNDLNGTCLYRRVVDPAGTIRDDAAGCQGFYPSGAPAGIRPTPNSGVYFVYQAVEVTSLQPDMPAHPVPDTLYDVPTWYFMHIYAAEVSSIQLVVPGHKAVTATIRGHWAVVRSPVTSAQEGTAPMSLRFLDSGGRVRWTYDINSGRTNPCSEYRSYGVPQPCPTGSPTTMVMPDGSKTWTEIPVDGSQPTLKPGG